MAWWIRPLELADLAGKGRGVYRLTAKSDEDGGGPHGLCDHEHATPAEAIECPDARAAAKAY